MCLLPPSITDLHTSLPSTCLFRHFWHKHYNLSAAHWMNVSANCQRKLTKTETDADLLGQQETNLKSSHIWQGNRRFTAKIKEYRAVGEPLNITDHFRTELSVWKLPDKGEAVRWRLLQQVVLHTLYCLQIVLHEPKNTQIHTCTDWHFKNNTVYWTMTGEINQTHTDTVHTARRMNKWINSLEPCMSLMKTTVSCYIQ